MKFFIQRQKEKKFAQCAILAGWCLAVWNSDRKIDQELFQFRICHRPAALEGKATVSTGWGNKTYQMGSSKNS